MWKETGKAYSFLLPFLLPFVFFIVVPIIYGIFFSFFQQRGVRSTFIGLNNYVTLFHDASFWSSFKIPIFIILIQVPIMLVTATVLALILDSGLIKHNYIYRLAYYLPYTIPTIIAGLIWGYMYSKTMSPFGKFFEILFGKDISFLSSEKLFWSMINIINWEWIGYNTVILFTFLLSIPPSLYEQAMLDGANRFQSAWYIKLPLLKPILFILFIFSIIGSFQIFNEPYILSSMTSILPNYTTSFYVYNMAFSYGNFNYAITGSLILGVVTFIFSFYFVKKAFIITKEE